jgi:hypothetical protein
MRGTMRSTHSRDRGRRHTGTRTHLRARSVLCAIRGASARKIYLRRCRPRLRLRISRTCQLSCASRGGPVRLHMRRCGCGGGCSPGAEAGGPGAGYSEYSQGYSEYSQGLGAPVQKRGGPVPMRRWQMCE